MLNIQNQDEFDSLELETGTYALLEQMALRDGCSVEQAINDTLTKFFESPQGQALDDPEHPGHAAAIAEVKATVAAQDEFDSLVRVATRRQRLH